MLARAFAGDGHDVVVLSRSGDAPAGPASAVAWGGRTLGPWAEEIDGADVVINLAGRSVNCRYTPANRRAIADSRVDSTRVAGEAIAQAARPPSVWLQSSTATIYAHRFDAPNDERSGILGGDEARAPDAWRFKSTWRAPGSAPSRVRIGLPTTKLMLEAGTVLMRTESEPILKSRRVVPGLLLDRGFSFEFSHRPAAARQLCDERLRTAR